MEIEFNNNKTTIVDFDFLRESYKNGRLKGADVLAKLLNINDNSSFKKEFNPKLFVNFDINMKYWNYFIIFLRTGIIFNSNINYIMEEITKLGGVPLLDKYYIKYNKLKNCKEYNPQKPEEDFRQLYDWVILTTTNLKSFQVSELGKQYQACTIFKNNGGITDYIYFRKKVKKNVELVELVDNFSYEENNIEGLRKN